MRIILSNKMVFLVAILGISISAVSVVMAWPSYIQFKNSDPKKDGFVQPRSVADLVRKTQLSTVTIYCYDSEKTYGQGSGWATDLEIEKDKDFGTAIVTNYHVLEDCINEDGTLKKNSLKVTKLYGTKEWPAIIYDIDPENDLAIILTSASVKPLQMAPNIPLAGYWVMAVGTADGYEGSVAFGNVLNFNDTEILITANISHGNSGGPLIDNEGKVIGTNTFSSKVEQYNGAKSLDAMCSVFIECNGDYYWEPEN